MPRRVRRSPDCQLHPSIPFNEELHGAAGFDHIVHGTGCEKHIHFVNTQQHIYTFTHTYLHILFLWVVYVYVSSLSSVGNNLPSIFQSVLLGTISKTFPNLVSWQLNSTTTANQTAKLWKAQPTHLDRPFSKGL